MIEVGNIKAGAKGGYIGRSMRGVQGSVLGNPFRMASEAERASVVTQYRTWITNAIQEGREDVLMELRRLQSLHRAGERVTLCCYCSPRSCHGDVLKEILEGATI